MYKFKRGMREISGFGSQGIDGKRYERACRRMVIAGMKFLDKHYEEPKFQAYENVFGLVIPSGDLAEQMRAEMSRAADKHGGASGAMMHACVNHVLHARKVGWGVYCKEMMGEHV